MKKQQDYEENNVKILRNREKSHNLCILKDIDTFLDKVAREKYSINLRLPSPKCKMNS